MKTRYLLTLLPLLVNVANATESIQSDIIQAPPAQKGQTDWKSKITKKEPSLRLAVNLELPESGSINDFATSGASSVSEQSASPDNDESVDQAEVADPWEGYNRSMYGFNNGLDKYIARPLAVAYDTVTPQYVQGCISRFFSNLREPGTAVNQTLQGKPLGGIKTLGRFVVNTTAGIAGLYDPATYIGLSKGYEDFGQTLAIWGWTDSRYFVAPLLGPRTLRDMVGIVGDQPLSPISQIDNSNVVIGLNIMQLTDARTRAFPYDEVRSQAIDEYIMVRDAWMTKRTNQIKQN